LVATAAGTAVVGAAFSLAAAAAFSFLAAVAEAAAVELFPDELLVLPLVGGGCDPLPALLLLLRWLLLGRLEVVVVEEEVVLEDEF